MCMARPRTTRPSLALDSKQVDGILAALSNGNDLIVSAAAFGVSRDLLARYLRHGAHLRATLKNPHSAHLDSYDAACVRLSEDAEKALATAEVRMAIAVGKAANAGDWRAAAWWLERRARTRWGEQVEVTGTVVTAEAQGADAKALVRARMDKLIDTALAARKAASSGVV